MFKAMNLQKLAILLIIVFVGAAVAAGAIFFAQYGFNFSSNEMFSGDIKGGVKVDEEKAENLQGLSSISAETDSIGINVIPTDSDQVKAHFYGTYKSSSPDYKPEMTVEKSSGSLRIKANFKPGIMVFGFNSNLKLDVYVPKQYAGELKTASVSGEITADGLSLDRFISKTTSGSLNAERISAKVVEIDTTSGETKINGTYNSFKFNSVSGSLTSESLSSKETSIGTTSGEINVSGTPGDLKASTISGSIVLEYADYSNKIDIETTSGEVSIKLPDSAGFNLDFQSTSGEAECAFPITESGSRGDNSLKGVVGGGGNSINVNSVSGTLRITK